mmetsp:Transcript_11411/g.35235  ORF Transcript_11411/g.35235 Transcript_11411/m.35235 type:complete len:217 (-) Transcript_11411:601-1251(-)
MLTRHSKPTWAPLSSLATTLSESCTHGTTRFAPKSGGPTSSPALARGCRANSARGRATAWSTKTRASPTAIATSCARSRTRTWASATMSSGEASILRCVRTSRRCSRRTHNTMASAPYCASSSAPPARCASPPTATARSTRSTSSRCVPSRVSRSSPSSCGLIARPGRRTRRPLVTWSTLRPRPSSPPPLGMRRTSQPWSQRLSSGKRWTAHVRPA